MALNLPVLVTQGSADRLILPAAAKYTAEKIPGAKLSMYDGIGHAPFWEDAARFNAELAAFVRAAGKPTDAVVRSGPTKRVASRPPS